MAMVLSQVTECHHSKYYDHKVGESTFEMFFFLNTFLSKAFFVDWLELIFITAPATYKYDACFKSGQNRPKKRHLTLLI